MADEKDVTDDHDKSTDSIFNEAILMTSNDNVSSATRNSLLLDSFASSRKNFISTAKCVISTEKHSADSTKQISRLYSLWEKKKQSMTKNDGAPSSKRFKHDLVSRYIDKKSIISDNTDNVCPTNEKFTTNSLEESNIWPALTILDQSLSECDGDTNRDKDEIIEKLYGRYNCSPRRFTEHLITILEESTRDFHEKPNDTVSPGLVKLSNNANDTGKVLDDESMPEYFISSSTGSGRSANHISSSSMEFTIITPDSLDEESNQFVTDSTQYTSLPAPNGKITEIPNLTYNKTPKILMNDNDNATVTPGPILTLLRKKTFRKTPKIVLYPGTPENKRISSLNIQSPKESKDDEYLTAGSECESDLQDQMLVETSSISNDETVNLSKVTFHHEEWINAYEKVSRYKPVNVASSSKISERKVKISNHTNKLKKPWLVELAKKRQTCFDMVDRMLKKTATKSTITENEYESLCYQRKIQFFDMLMACSDYFTYMTVRDSFETKSSNNKNRRSIAKSSPKLNTRRSLSHSRIHNVTKQNTRKSLEKKGTRMKGPVLMGKKSPMRRSIGKRPNGATPEIDRSSIRSVRELRRIYSPRPVIQATLETKIPLLKRPMWKSYVPPSTTSVSKVSSAISKLDVGGPRLTKKFKNVKSPVREYIRKEYKKPSTFVNS